MIRRQVAGRSGGSIIQTLVREHSSRPGVPRLSLRLSLLAGAIYDLIFAGLILLVPEKLAPLIGVPLPDDQFYLRFLSVFLVGLAAMYLLPAWAPERYLGVILAAVLVRGLGCVFLCLAVAFHGRPWGLAVLGGVDGLFALVHGILLVVSVQDWGLGGRGPPANDGFAINECAQPMPVPSSPCASADDTI